MYVLKEARIETVHAVAPSNVKMPLYVKGS